MLYGFISRNSYGNYVIRVGDYDFCQYIWYTKKQAVALYRQNNGLKYKHIVWIDFTKKGEQ